MANTQHSRWTVDYWFRYSKAILLRALAFIPLAIGIRKALQNVPEDIAVERLDIRSREKGRRIKIRLFYRKDISGRALPVHLNWHGSGFTLPQFGSDSNFCARIAADTPTIVVDCDYRKAPECAYPLPFEDAEDVLAYCKSHPERFDTDKVTLSGFSAGFAMAAFLAIKMGDRAKGLISFYGNCDYTQAFDPPSNVFESGRQLSRPLRKFFYDNMFTPTIDRSNPGISLKFNPTSAFPKHCIFIVGDADYLYHPARALTTRLKEERHPDTIFMPIEKCAHGWDKFPRTTASRQRKEDAYAASVELVKRALND